MTQHHFIFDFDATLVTVESLDELARIALQGNPEREIIQREVEEITRLGMEGKLAFAESLSRRLTLFSPTAQHLVDLVELLRASVTDSVARNMDFFRKRADTIYVISGGFREYIVPVVRGLGIAETQVRANEGILGPERRVTEKTKLVRSLNLDGIVHVIGDGWTDYEIRKEGAADDFIAFTENVYREPVVQKADYSVANFDELVYLLEEHAW